MVRVALFYGQRPSHKGNMHVLLFSSATPCKDRVIKAHNKTAVDFTTYQIEIERVRGFKKDVV